VVGCGLTPSSRLRVAAILGSESPSLGDRLLVLAHGTVRGHGSGIPLTGEFASLATLGGDGKVVREQRYTSHAEALQTAGLRE
jgi:hypothetical protein